MHATASPPSQAPADLTSVTSDVERAMRALTQNGRLTRLHHRLNRVADVDLDRPAFIAMACLDEAGEMGLSALADASGVEISTMSRLVDRLVAAGLVEATRSARDQRAVLLRLSPRGQEVVRRLKAIRRQVLTDLLADWTPAEQATFAALLTRFVGGLDAFMSDQAR